MIRVTCESCDKKHNIQDSLAGKTATCPCGSKIKIPLLDEEPDEIAYDEDRLFTPLGIGLLVVAVVLVGALLIYGNGKYKRFARDKESTEAFNAAEEAREAKNYDEAYDKYKAVSKLQPQWDAPILEAALIAARLKKKDARKLLKKAVKLSSVKKRQKAILYCNLGLIALRRKKPAQKTARKHFNAALKYNPNLPRPHLMLASLDFAKGDLKSAQVHLDAIPKKLGELAKTKTGMKTYRLLKLRMAFATRDKDAWLAAYTTAKPLADAEKFALETSRMALHFLLANPATDLNKDKRILELSEQGLATVKDKALLTSIHGALAKLYYREKNFAAATKYLALASPTGSPPSAYSQMQLSINIRRSQDEKDATKKSAAVADAIRLFKQLVADEAYRKKHGATLVLNAIGFCDLHTRKDDARAFLTTGLAAFPKSALLLRRSGYLKFQEADALRGEATSAALNTQRATYQAGIKQLEESLAIDPAQKQLASDLKAYRTRPVIDGFRSTAPRERITRPLLRVRIQSGAPFAIASESVKLTLDGKPYTPIVGGNEYFYTPKAALKPGKHLVEATASDLVGNTSSAKFPFAIDTTPPKAELVSPRGFVQDALPLLTLRLYDEFSRVDPASVSITIRHRKGSANTYSANIIQKGRFRIADDKLGYAKGDRPKNFEKLAFRLVRPLKAGEFEITITMTDTQAHKAKIKLPFSFVGE